MSYRQVADSPDFLLVRAKLRAMLGTPSEAVREFENLLRDKKFVSEGATHFGLAIALTRQREWAAAEVELSRARQSKVSAALLDRQLAEVKLARGDNNAALAIYREAMLRYPLNLALVYGYGQALIKVRRFDDAQHFAELQLQNYPQDVRLHKMRAESYAGLGRGAQQHQALAEAFALQGQTAGAIEQLLHAQRAGDADFYEQSVIETRLGELRKRLAEEQKEKRNWR